MSRTPLYLGPLVAIIHDFLRPKLSSASKKKTLKILHNDVQCPRTIKRGFFCLFEELSKETHLVVQLAGSLRSVSVLMLFSGAQCERIAQNVYRSRGRPVFIRQCVLFVFHILFIFSSLHDFHANVDKKTKPKFSTAYLWRFFLFMKNLAKLAFLSDNPPSTQDA